METFSREFRDKAQMLNACQALETLGKRYYVRHDMTQRLSGGWHSRFSASKWTVIEVAAVDGPITDEEGFDGLQAVISVQGMEIYVEMADTMIMAYEHLNEGPMKERVLQRLVSFGLIVDEQEQL
ncbi:hypothetical protein [Paenibacillus sp. RUD330]|uniref:hypothetical protein n=1 Tax=Paenibacillus sp. RUD330 TaxID=2023772 RepID=UPI000B929314|nr:hypothetical protein [Paenibacillus sp. RUD330]ASS66562.1 hypothetical protein CIC07_10620 [Paenibacillus sp. RUD330]